MASVLTEPHPSTLPHQHLQSQTSPNTTLLQLPPTPAAAAAAAAATSPSQQTTTTSTLLRSEKLLRDMLTKDGVARSRSLSRSSSTNHHPQQLAQPSAPPLPLPTPAVATTTPVKQTTNGPVRNGSVSGHSRSSSGTDDRPIFASTGFGGAPALVFRSHPTNSRRTMDGTSSSGLPPNLSPPLATRHHTSPLPLQHHYQQGSPSHPPPPLVHANSSPLIGARSRLPGANSMGIGPSAGIAVDDVDVEGDWYDEECASPSPTSIHSSSSSRDSLHPLPNHRHQGPLTPPHHHHQPPSHARRHMLSDTPPMSGASSTFDLESASEYCRQHVGYVSFGDIEGLGRPAAEEEEERVERLRLMREGEEGGGKRKKWLWSWLGNTSAAQEGSEEVDVGVRRPKTPGLA